jgi:hypothetical protein
MDKFDFSQNSQVVFRERRDWKHNVKIQGGMSYFNN